MPASQGRPLNGECPFNANDKNVRHTQGDLFLYPDCEEFKFPSTSSSKGVNQKGTGTKKLVQAGVRCKAAS